MQRIFSCSVVITSVVLSIEFMAFSKNVIVVIRVYDYGKHFRFSKNLFISSLRLVLCKFNSGHFQAIFRKRITFHCCTFYKTTSFQYHMVVISEMSSGTVNITFLEHRFAVSYVSSNIIVSICLTLNLND